MSLFNAKKIPRQILRHIGCVVLCLCLVQTQGLWAKNQCSLNDTKKRSGCSKKVSSCATACKLPVIHDQDEFSALSKQDEKRSFSGLMNSGSKLDLEGFPPSALLVVGTDNQNFTTGMFNGPHTGTDLFGIRNGTIPGAAFSVAQMDPGMFEV